MLDRAVRIDRAPVGLCRCLDLLRLVPFLHRFRPEVRRRSHHGTKAGL
jgi:hypothetical protein